MPAALHLVLTLAIVLVNFAALGAVCQRWIADRQAARAAGLLALVLVLFFVEHFVGLKTLAWTWPATTIAALALLRRRLLERAFLAQELPFLLPLLWALAWRYAYPDIEPTAEQIPDLYFVSNYAAGERLPPPDLWLPGARFDFYYGLLHYAVALLARWLALDRGYALNLGGAILFGLLGSLAWSIVARFGAPRAARAARRGGGGGRHRTRAAATSPVSRRPIKQAWAGVRFIGLYDREAAPALASRLFAASPRAGAGDDPPELPLETPGYLLHIGDVHPPLGGFVLLLLALALIAGLHKPQQAEDPRALALALGASATAAWAVNAWVFPLHVLLVSGWALYRRLARLPAHGAWLALGALAAAALLAPFLTYFTAQAPATAPAATAAHDLTPWRQGLLIWWPVLWLVALSLTLGPRLSLARWSALGALALWLLAEAITIDDYNGGRYQRFNTVLKWWSWLYLGALVWLAAINLGAQRSWRRWAAAVPLAASAMYLAPLGSYWAQTPRPHAGRLQGDGWLRAETSQRALLEWLRTAPRGLVLESVERGAYAPTAALALFSGQPSALGWPDHVAQWRASPLVRARAEAARRLYRGQLPDAADWLQALSVSYVVWRSEDSAAYGGDALARLRAQLHGRYVWVPMDSGAPLAAGVLVRATERRSSGRQEPH